MLYNHGIHSFVPISQQNNLLTNVNDGAYSGGVTHVFIN